jgi:hypothetical protein
MTGSNSDLGLMRAIAVIQTLQKSGQLKMLTSEPILLLSFTFLQVNLPQLAELKMNPVGASKFVSCLQDNRISATLDYLVSLTVFVVPTQEIPLASR